MTRVDTKPTLPTCGDASGRSLGTEELALLERAIASGTLTSTKGTLVREFETRVSGWLDLPFCRATSSGTAAIHAAIAAVDPEPGDEIITTPITDMGAITPILYQTAIPVFADVDPRTLNVTAETIAARITPHTRAVIVTHLFGQCCDMDPILELCRERRLPVIEDCAQAYGATYKGRLAGTMGAIGCFSLQQSKHITSGEGGFVVTAHPRFERRMRLWIDKAWPYGEPNADHEFLALNARMTELQGAVACAQFDKLDELIARRRRAAERLTDLLEAIPGVSGPAIVDGAEHTYWRFPLDVDESVIPGGVDALGRRLSGLGLACAPRYTRKLAYECRVFRERSTFGRSRFPFEGPHMQGRPPVRYSTEDTPGAVEALRRVIVLGWNENLTDQHVDWMAGVIEDAVGDVRSESTTTCI